MDDAFLQQLPGVWRAASLASAGVCIPTGYEALDAALGGGWPTPALIELLCDQQGIGELQLLLPLLKQLSAADRKDEEAVFLWLNPPHALQATALVQQGLNPAQHWVSIALTPRDTLWAMEQALRSGACGAAIAWVSQIDMASLRRLTLAASVGRCLGVLFRPSRDKQQVSPATLRIELNAHGSYLQVGLLKMRGRLPTDVMIDVQSRST